MHTHAGLLGLVLALVAPGAAIATVPPGDGSDADATAAAAAAAEETVTITIADHEVPGTLTRPANGPGPAPAPAVLMLHGFASQRDEVGDLYRDQAARLADHGIASLRIDFAGSGDSTQPFTANTWDGMVDDAVHAYDWLSAQPGIDADRIGVLGFSNGAKVGLQVMVDRPHAALFASWSGALEDGLPGGGGELRAAAEADGTVVNDLGFAVIEMSIDWFTSMERSSPVADAVEAGYDRPLLLVVGSADDTVLPATSAKFDAETYADDTTLVVIDGADHIFNVLDADRSSADEVLDVTTDWFADRLAVPAP